MKNGISLFFAILVLAGCASMSESECLEADWYQVGLRDGQDGYPLARLDQHRKACSEYGVEARRDAWRAGRQEGLRGYCTAERGYEAGRAGKTYHRVCTPRQERDFLPAYEAGESIYQMELELDNIEREIESLDDKLDEDSLSDRRRQEIRVEIQQLFRQARQLQNAILREERRYQP